MRRTLTALSSWKENGRKSTRTGRRQPAAARGDGTVTLGTASFWGAIALEVA